MPYSFIHVMKTAGTTLHAHVRANFPGGLYPDPDQDDMERRDRVVFYCGHLPYVASQLMGIDLVTLTLLRDPVERTVSFLELNKLLTPRHQDLSLDEICDDEFFHPALVLDHQTKVFSMRPGDELLNVYEFIDTKRFRESTDPWEASPSLRRRIAEENAIDMEFYEFARELCRDGVHCG